MKNNNLSVKKGQQLTADLVDCLTQSTVNSRELLEYIIDEYLYLVSDEKIKELEGIIVNEYEYD